ncbi:titin homolog [Belonocnema kinseyi]|uniref:titin homolog n=1 Tax=Belonocnema kinseyi TaxID=2817044 RepID=UPI00143DBB3A|nr:titin homolog [Belonocnema kinseyi]
MATSTKDMKVPEGFLVAPRVPQGLAAAVEGLTREVIRHHPEDIYVFAAHHFEKLLHIREQYGASRSLSVDEKNLQALQDMSEVLRRRDAFKEEKTPRDIVFHSGWSLNETAKVLDRHRSIFGDEGKTISTEEVRELATHKETRQSEHFGRHRAPEKKSSRRKEDCRESPGMRNGPKIISQIPTLPGNTVKDIKSELRKNRISSRERRNHRNQKTEMESEVLKTTSRTSLEKSEWSERRQRTDRRERTERTERIERSVRKDEKRRNSEKKVSRGLSMDRVKEYVVRKFATTKSLEELQSRSYVEKVQEVIDETAPIIKEKVEELKNSMSSKRNFSKEDSKSKEYSKSKEQSVSKEALKSNPKDSSRSNELKENTKSNESKENSRSRKVKKTQVSDPETPDDSLEDVETLKSEVESIGHKNALEARLSETQTLLEGISSSFMVPMRRSTSAKDLRHRISEASDVSLPVVRPFSSKSHSRSVSRSDSDNLVLPLISPEVTKSTKIKEELVLPVLSTSGSASNLEGKEEIKVEENDDSDKDIAGNRDGRDIRNGSDGEAVDNRDKKEEERVKADEENYAEKMNSIEEEIKLSAVDNMPLTSKELREVETEVEEVFRDSLNVTPEPLDTPQRPDSLEPEEEKATVRDGPLGLKEQLLEIQNVEKEIECLLNPEGNEVVKDKEQVQFSIRGKLQEVEDSERRIQDILGEGKVELAVSVKEKLKEVEEVEKRIETFLDEPLKVEILNPKDEVDSIETNSRETEKKAICKTLENEKICEVGAKEGEEVGDSKEEKEGGDTIRKDNDEQLSKERDNKSVEEQKESVKTEKKEREEDELREEEDEEDDSNSSKKTIPFSFVLTEGSPCEIPDSVTTVIIPDRIPTPDSDTLEIEVEEGEFRSKLISNKSKNSNKDETKLAKGDESVQSSEDSHPNLEVFGELVRLDSSNGSTINIDLINNKIGHDLMIPYQDLDQIKEEDDKDLAQIKEDDKKQKSNMEKMKELLEIEEESDQIEEGKEEIKEDEEVKENQMSEKLQEENFDEEELKVLKVMTAALKEEEELQLKEKSKPQEGEESSPEVLRLTDSESTDETKESTITDEVLEAADAVENSLEVEESTGRSIESTNEVKETTMTDQTNASLSLDPGMPIVPELNLDSLQDLTVSSFKMTDEEMEKRESEETGSVASITEPETDRKDEKMEERGPDSESDDGRIKEEEKVKEVAGKKGEESKGDVMDGLDSEGTELKDRKVEEEVVEMLKERKDNNEMGRLEVKMKKEQEEQDEIKENLEIIKRIEEQEDEIMESVEATERIEEGKVKENVELQEELEAIITDSEINKRKEDAFTAVEEIKDKRSDNVNEENVLESLEALGGSEEQEIKEEVVKEQVVIKEDTFVKTKAYVTTSGGENEEEEGEKKADEESKKEEIEKVGERQEEMRNDQEQKVVQKSEEIKKENEESSQISARETLRDEEEETQKGDSDVVESRSASQCTTRRLSSDNLRSREENLVRHDEKVEGKEEVEIDALINDKEEKGELKIETEEIAKPEVVTNAINDEMLEEKIEYHIYVPESMEDSSSDSSTFISAATRIQAGVRGFLTRRRLQSLQSQCRSSTLDSVSSIPESFVVEPGTITESLLSPIEEVNQAATTIQNNYRRYNARKRLKREDAIQRTTLSLENAFAENGLQHTGEFHDCVPLPVFKLKKKDFGKKKSPGSSSLEERDKEVGKYANEEENKSGGRDENNGKDKNSGRDECIGSAEKDKNDGMEEKDKKYGVEENKERYEDRRSNKTEGKDNEGNKIQGDDKITGDKNEPKELNKTKGVRSHLGPNISCTHPGMSYYPQEEIHFPSDLPNGYKQSEQGNIFLNQPPFHLGLNPKIGPIFDIFLLSKEDPMIQNNYLNFITSVEDEINQLDIPKVESEKNLGVENPSDSGESISIREPLALPGTPKGIVIEEVTSLDETVRSISGSISLEDRVLRSEVSKEEENVVDGSEEKRGVDDEHFLESFEEERERKGGQSKVEGVHEIEEERCKEGNDIGNLSIRDEETDEKENEGESLGSLGDREFLESSLISLDDPTSPGTTRTSSAARKKIQDVTRKEEIYRNEEFREPSLVNLKEEFREEDSLLNDTISSVSEEKTLSTSKNRKIISLDEENGGPSSSGKEISSMEEEIKSSSLSGKENSLLTQDRYALRKETNSSLKEDKISLREESHSSLKEEEIFSVKEEKNSSLKEEGPASITNNKPFSFRDQSFKDDFSNFEDSSLVPDASLSTLSFSMNIEDVLGLGLEEECCKEFRKTNFQINHIPGSFGSSQDSQNSEKSIATMQSPVTMMQIAPNSLEDDKAFGTSNGVQYYKEENREGSKETEDKKDEETKNIKERKTEMKERTSPKKNDSDSFSEKSSKERTKVLEK